MSNIIKYSRDELMSLNVYGLRQIPTDSRYDILRKFVGNGRNVKLYDIIKNPIVPTYLKNRYSDLKMGNTTGKTTNQLTRRKLYTQKTETVSDKINEKIRDLLSKLSEGNKEKLFNEFVNLDIPDECGQTLIHNIYMFAVDLSYLIPIYTDLILILKDKNIKLYNQLINKIITTAQQPLDPNDADSKRLRTGNILLISELYKKHTINSKVILQIIQFLVNRINPQSVDYLNLLCELLKHTLYYLKQDLINELDIIIQSLLSVVSNHDYEKKYRFMVDDVIELYNTEDE